MSRKNRPAPAQPAAIASIAARPRTLAGAAALAPAPAASPREDMEELLREAYVTLLRRPPDRDAPEYAYWMGRLESDLSPAGLIRSIRDSKEGRRKRGVDTFAPAGHFYSPVVDPGTVRDYVKRERAEGIASLEAIQVDVNAMRQLLRAWADAPGDISIPEEAGGPERFSMARSTQYPFGDAWALKAVIRHLRPNRIVEIGSGSTTGCMLDALDSLGLDGCQVTCIEPFPDKIHQFLRPEDFPRIELLQQPAQEVDTAQFATMRAGDILFVDSTHVLKTGSDVHFIFFHILPLIPDGVWIHFHDCMYPFEYPDKWIFTQNNSWNEIYMLRAFLMHNDRYRIRYWSSLLSALHPQDQDDAVPGLNRRPGSGIWIEKIAAHREPGIAG